VITKKSPRLIPNATTGIRCAEEAGSGVEALQKLESGPIDVMLCDVNMPEMNGTELRDRIKAIRPGIKVLFMSGYSSDVIGHHGVLEKGVHFVQKPFGLKGLARKVRDAIEGQRSGGSPKGGSSIPVC